MATDNVATDDGAGNGTTTARPVTWRELAVARSLDSARTRAENRVQRFIDAALELMGDSDGKEFTVQDVVERSGQSLRSFYQYFGGKHELLLALFEESLRATTEHLRERVAAETGPRERLHAFVIEYFRLSRPRSKGKGSRKVSSISPVLIEFAQQLLTAHPADAARAFLPMVTLLEELLAEAEEAGVVRAGTSRRSIAGIVLEATSFNVFSATIGGELARRDVDEAAEELWELLFEGLAAPSA